MVIVFSSDETAEDLNSRAPGRRAGQLRSSVGRGDSQEITYVPTSVLKGHNQGQMSRAPNGNEVIKSLCIIRDLRAKVVATSFVKN